MKPPPFVAVAVVLAAALVGCFLKPGHDGQATGPPTQCELCHSEVRAALLKADHGKAGHVCATCHGVSARHSWSEDGHFAPDRPLKTRRQIDPLCKDCHKKAKHPAKLNIDRKCTACHEPHPKKEGVPESVSRGRMPDEV